MTKTELDKLREKIYEIMRFNSEKGVQYSDSKYPNELTREILVSLVEKSIQDAYDKGFQNGVFTVAEEHWGNMEDDFDPEQLGYLEEQKRDYITGIISNLITKQGGER